MARGLGDGDGPLNDPRWLRLAPVPPAAFLVAFLVVPAVMVVRYAFDPSALAALSSPATWQIMLLAILQASASTALALALGVPLANVVTRYRFRRLRSPERPIVISTMRCR